MAYLPFPVKGLGNLQRSFQGILEQFRQGKKLGSGKWGWFFFLQWGRCHHLQKQCAVEVNTGYVFWCLYVHLCSCIKHERKGAERREVWKTPSLIIDVSLSQWRVIQFMPPCSLRAGSALTDTLLMWNALNQNGPCWLCKGSDMWQWELSRVGGNIGRTEAVYLKFIYFQCLFGSVAFNLHIRFFSKLFTPYGELQAWLPNLFLLLKLLLFCMGYNSCSLVLLCLSAPNSCNPFCPFLQIGCQVALTRVWRIRGLPILQIP